MTKNENVKYDLVEIKILVKEIKEKNKQYIIYSAIDKMGGWHNVKFKKDYDGYKPNETAYYLCDFDLGKKQPDFVKENGTVIKGTHDLWINHCEYARPDDYKEKKDELKNDLFR
jgi:hypothetical protein